MTTNDIQGRLPGGNTLLIEAALKNDCAQVSALLNKCKSKSQKLSFVNMTNQNGRTALYEASIRGYSQVAEILMQNGADRRRTGFEGQTALMIACKHGNINHIKQLLSNQDRMECKHSKDNNERTAYYHAAENKQAIAAWLLHQANIQWMDYGIGYQGQSPIHIAASNGNLECFSEIIQQYAKTMYNQVNGEENQQSFAILVEQLDYDHNNVLHLASMENNVRLLEYILTLNCSKEFIDKPNNRKLTPVMCAAKCGHTEIIRILFKFGAVLQNESKQDSCIHLACSEGKLESVALIQQLQNQSFDPYVRDKDGLTPLMLASKYGNLTCLQFMLKVVQNECTQAPVSQTMQNILQQQCKQGNKTIHLAVRSQNVEVVRAVLAFGAEQLWLVDGNEQNSLSLACMLGQKTIVEEIEDLLKRSYQPNILKDYMQELIHAPDRKGNCALHHTCEVGCDGILDVLKAYFPDVTLTNHAHETPRMLAERNGHFYCFQRLLVRDKLVLQSFGQGASHQPAETNQYACRQQRLQTSAPNKKQALYLQSNSYWRILHLSCECKNLALIRMMLKANVPLTGTDPNGNSALHYIVQQFVDKDDYWDKYSIKHVIKELVEAGMDINCRNMAGKSPLMIAAKHHNRSMFKWLIFCGADINAVDNSGDSVSHHVAFWGHIEHAKTLYNANANMEIKNFLGETPLMKAQKYKQNGIFQWLRNNIADRNAGSPQFSFNPQPDQAQLVLDKHTYPRPCDKSPQQADNSRWNSTGIQIPTQGNSTKQVGQVQERSSGEVTILGNSVTSPSSNQHNMVNKRNVSHIGSSSLDIKLKKGKISDCASVGKTQGNPNTTVRAIYHAKPSQPPAKSGQLMGQNFFPMFILLICAVGTMGQCVGWVIAYLDKT